MERIPFPARDWVARGACRTAPAELFFPGEGYRGLYEEAAIICARCVVRRPCLEWALANEYHGFWGGTSERQRVKLRKAIAHRSVAV